MDSRTGLGRFREFSISNYQLMMKLIDYCRNHTIEEILLLPDVKERVDLFFQYHDRFDEQIKRCSTIHGEVIVLDLMNEEIIWPGNRFYIYAMYHKCSISIHKMWGFQKQNVVLATGGSIFKRGFKTNIGELMLKYGGGHEAARTCQIAVEDSERVLSEIIGAINKNEV
jgi:nanoRNase/pAp phosphatase (c-di-AMP/oligoRNAs hydrolase)